MSLNKDLQIIGNIHENPELLEEVNRIFMHIDEDPVAEMHYSPYWGGVNIREKLHKGRQRATDRRINGTN